MRSLPLPVSAASLGLAADDAPEIDGGGRRPHGEHGKGGHAYAGHVTLKHAHPESAQRPPAAKRAAAAKRTSSANPLSRAPNPSSGCAAGCAPPSLASPLLNGVLLSSLAAALVARAAPRSPLLKEASAANGSTPLLRGTDESPRTAAAARRNLERAHAVLAALPGPALPGHVLFCARDIAGGDGGKAWELLFE
ncbi:hypothetical protein TeGR_g2607, partial [Tetraparma gracilis]